MLKDFLQDNIQVLDKASDWEDAISIAAEPLKNKGIIQKEYVDSMIENVKINGSYIVIAPRVAIPHSRPENGVLSTGISLLKLINPVTFPEEKKVDLMIVLAAKDSETHLELIAELANLIMEDELLEQLLSATSKDEVLACLS